MSFLYLTFILSISYFHMFYKHIPHKNTHTHISYIFKLFYTSPSLLQKYLFLDSTITSHLLYHAITHYPYLSHYNILKLHHFATQKHISISFFISHTRSPFLESNITHDITQKPLQQ